MTSGSEPQDPQCELQGCSGDQEVKNSQRRKRRMPSFTQWYKLFPGGDNYHLRCLIFPDFASKFKLDKLNFSSCAFSHNLPKAKDKERRISEG